MGTGLNFRNWVRKYPSTQDSWIRLHAHTLRYEVVPRLQLGWLEGTFHDKNGLTGNMATKRVFTTLYGTCWLQSYNAINNEIPTSAAFCGLQNLIFVICDKENLNCHLPPLLENVKKDAHFWSMAARETETSSYALKMARITGIFCVSKRYILAHRHALLLCFLDVEIKIT